MVQEVEVEEVWEDVSPAEAQGDANAASNIANIGVNAVIEE
jgi:hypothetical protein